MKIKFPFDFFPVSSKPDDVYLGLYLKEKEGMVIFIETKWNKLEILAKEYFSYTNGWDNIIEDVDDVLYKLETQTKKSPGKAIFFIYSHLLDETTKEIKRPFLHKIKELSKNLELKPMGYIECHEGISAHLEEKDSVAPTCTLVEIDSSLLSVFVYKSGKVTYRETVQRTEEIVDDLIPILERVKHIAMIPTRVVLYDSKQAGIQAEKILSYKWSPEIFMQLPKVEIIQEQDLLDSLVSVFSSQVLTPTPTEEQEKQEVKESFGFVIGGDVGPQQEVRKEEQEIPTSQFNDKKKNPLTQILSQLSTFFKTVSAQLTTSGGKLKTVPIPILAIVGTLLILLAIFLMEFYLHKAEVTIFFPGKQIEKALVIASSVRPKAQELKLIKDSATTQFTDSIKTTGKKDVGEKATGSVTIYNSSLTESKSFAKGTTITSPNSIEFILNADTKIASASGDATSITPATTKAEVIAKEIGPEGNIGGGTKFNIEGESVVVIAKNDDAFSGGVKRTIQTVGKQDADSLTKKAMDAAKRYNEKEVQKKLKKEEKILTNLSIVELQNPQFSHEIGEETGELSLKSKIAITYYSYDENELLQLIQNQLKEDLARGFELPKNTIRYSVKKIDTEKDKYKVRFNIKAKQVKSIEKDQMEKVLTGKKEIDLEKILKERYGATGLEFNINSPLPFFKDRLPFLRKNINLKVSYL